MQLKLSPLQERVLIDLYEHRDGPPVEAVEIARRLSITVAEAVGAVRILMCAGLINKK